MRSGKCSQQLQRQRNTFLPTLCSSSTMDQVKLSHRRCSSSSSSSLSEEPSSPRVGCMGQVKRNNKVVGFPTIIGFTTTNAKNEPICSNNNTSSIVKYQKLKRFFSIKTLTNYSPTSTTIATRAVAHGTASIKTKISSRNVRNISVSKERKTGVFHHHRHQGCNKNSKGYSQKGCLVNLEELDPPLPVVKRVLKQQQEEEGKKGEHLSLWKRRSGGAPLKSLQVQVAQQQDCVLHSANTV